MEIKEIYDLYEKYIDKEICVSGWIRKHRKQKEIGFIEISDGTVLITSFSTTLIWGGWFCNSFTWFANIRLVAANSSTIVCEGAVRNPLPLK